MTLEMLQVLSFAVGLLAYLSLIIFCGITWFRRITGKALFSAASLTFLFLLSLAMTGESPVTTSLELLALFAWNILLIRAIGLDLSNYRNPELRGVVYLATGGAALLVLAILYLWQLPPSAFFTQNKDITPVFVAEILLCVSGLVAIEQLVRNSRDDYRWRLRYLNIGLGMLFTFGLLHNAVALLFSMHVPLLSILQPSILAIAVPFIAIASLRNRQNQLRLNLSRQFVFRSGVLIACGAGLLLMGLAGYYIQLFGGEIAVAAGILIATLVIVGIFVVVGSSRFQRGVQRLIAENLYESKHDYRDHWNSVTRQLTEPNPDFSLAQQSVRALLAIFESQGGAVWRYVDGSLVHEDELHVNWNTPLAPATGTALSQFFEQHEWIIDLESIPAEAAETLASCSDLTSLDGLRFLIPLFVEQRLLGLVAISEPEGKVVLSWEDYDIVKLISREAAGFLALRLADSELSDSRQFDTMNRLSAFVIHDVKTISAQLSLLLENAEKHKTNPAFIDDMLDTVDNAVQRMQGLLAQLKQERDAGTETIRLDELLPDVVSQFRQANPTPELISYNPDATVRANRDRLASIIGHTLQNAIDATAAEGAVCLRAQSREPWLELTIEDTGTGMDRNFIDKQLFAPFESTKGLAGMGVGAFQVREYVRSLGGDVLVDSQPGRGTRFTLLIPLAA